MKRIHYEPYLGAYLIMINGVGYAIQPDRLSQVVTRPDEVVITAQESCPPGCFSVPIKVQIQATNRCNMRCLTCAVFGSPKNKVIGELSTKEMFELLNNLAMLGVLNIEWSGGEPLLRRDFKDLVIKTSELGFEQSLFTNGTCFNTKNTDLLKHFYRVQVSIDAVGGKYDTIVGARMFDCLKNSLEIIGQSGVEVVAATVLQESNVDDLHLIIELCSIYGIAKNRISLQVPIGRSAQVCWKNYQKTIDKFRQNLPYLKELASSSGVVLDSFLDKQICLNEQLEDVGKLVSPGGYSFLYVNSIGEMFPFPFLTEPRFYLGSIRDMNEEQLLLIWNKSPVLTELRNLTYGYTGCGCCRLECAFAERSMVYAVTGQLKAPALEHAECLIDQRKCLQQRKEVI